MKNILRNFVSHFSNYNFQYYKIINHYKEGEWLVYFEIHFTFGDNTSDILKVCFAYDVCKYKVGKDIYSFGVYNEPENLTAASIYLVENSTLAEEVLQSDHRLTSNDIKSYLFITDEDYIEVVSSCEPTFEIGKKEID